MRAHTSHVHHPCTCTHARSHARTHAHTARASERASSPSPHSQICARTCAPMQLSTSAPTHQHTYTCVCTLAQARAHARTHVCPGRTRPCVHVIMCPRARTRALTHADQLGSPQLSGAMGQSNTSTVWRARLLAFLFGIGDRRRPCREVPNLPSDGGSDQVRRHSRTLQLCVRS